jgi:hypothetical protein
MTERICSKEESFENALRVSKQLPSSAYAPIRVTIVSSNKAKRTVTFTVSDEQNAQQTFPDVPWGGDDMVLECPTTLPFVAGQLPEPTAEGTLYLSVKLMEKLKFKELQISGTPKFPRELPAGPLLGRLQIRATSIVVTGVELADGQDTPITINLLDPKFAAQKQTIELHGKTITVLLTPAGFIACGHLTLQPEDAVDPITAKQK